MKFQRQWEQKAIGQSNKHNVERQLTIKHNINTKQQCSKYDINTHAQQTRRLEYQSNKHIQEIRNTRHKFGENSHNVWDGKIPNEQ